MRAGGGHQKGSAFERYLCRNLSLWLSHGSRANLFSRNVLSGGRFTIAARTTGEIGQPGDMTAADPLAFAFTDVFAVEAKHWRSLKLDTLLINPWGRSDLSKVVQKNVDDAQRAGLRSLVICKQNNYPIIVLADTSVLLIAADLMRDRRGLGFTVHRLHNERVAMTTFENFVRVPPDKFLAAVQAIANKRTTQGKRTIRGKGAK